MNNIVLRKEVTHLQLRTENYHKLHRKNTTIISVMTETKQKLDEEH
jgi:hypothetical protein